MTTVFTLPYPAGKRQRAAFFRDYSLNSVYAGKHWAKRRADAQAWHWLVTAQLKRQGVPAGMFQEPVKITFRWDDGLDIDNHALMAKMTVDALKGWLLRDDSRRCYRAVTHEFWDGGCIRVEVSEE